MHTKKIFDEIKSCSSPIRFAIMKALEKEPMNYAYLSDYVGIRIGDAKFGYHLRKLVSNHLVVKKFNDKAYKITQKGKTAIHVLEELSERYMAEDKEQICPNDDNSKHEFIQVCRKCSMILKPLEILR